MNRNVYKLVQFVEMSTAGQITDRMRWSGEEAAKIAGIFWNFRHWPEVADKIVPVLLEIPRTGVLQPIVAQIARAAVWDHCQRERFDALNVVRTVTRTFPAAALAAAEELYEQGYGGLTLPVEFANLAVREGRGSVVELAVWAGPYRLDAERPAEAPPERDPVAVWDWLLWVSRMGAHRTEFEQQFRWAGWFSVYDGQIAQNALAFYLNQVAEGAAGQLPSPVVIRSLVRKARRSAEFFGLAETAVERLVAADRTRYIVELLPEIVWFSDDLQKDAVGLLAGLNNQDRLDALFWFYGSLLS